jgi:hypothetical protein
MAKIFHLVPKAPLKIKIKKISLKTIYRMKEALKIIKEKII